MERLQPNFGRNEEIEQAEIDERIAARHTAEETLVADPDLALDPEHAQDMRDHTPKEWRDKLRELVDKFAGGAKEKVEWWKSSEEHLIRRSRELDAEAEKMGEMEKLIRLLGEKYNKVGWKTKLAVGLGLGLGAGALSTVSVPAAAACLSGVALQRIAGLSTMFLKYEKTTQEGKWKKEKAMGKAMLYTAAMTAGTVLLIEGVKEGVEYANQHQWGEQVREWLGKMLGHHAPEAPAHPAAAAAAGEAAVHTPEMPTVGASPGRGYEDMVERLWKELQGKNLNPNQYPPNSDIHRLLLADEHSIGRVAHQIASDPKYGHNFYHADGTNIRIDPSAHMTIGADDGQIHFGDATHPDMVNAAGDMHVTPAYHPEAPVPHPPAEAAVPPPPPAPVEAAAAPHITPQPAPAAVEHAVTPPTPDNSVVHDGSGGVLHDSAGNPIHTGTYQPGHEAHVAHTAGAESVTNHFGTTVSMKEPHFYTDPGAKHLLIYGGSPAERANAIQEYLVKKPDGVVFSADDSGKYRIPWHLVGGKATPGAPVETRGFLGFFKSFMKAPEPEEFEKLIK